MWGMAFAACVVFLILFLSKSSKEPRESDQGNPQYINIYPPFPDWSTDPKISAKPHGVRLLEHSSTVRMDTASPHNQLHIVKRKGKKQRRQ